MDRVIRQAGVRAALGAAMLGMIATASTTAQAQVFTVDGTTCTVTQTSGGTLTSTCVGTNPGTLTCNSISGACTFSSPSCSSGVSFNPLTESEGAIASRFQQACGSRSQRTFIAQAGLVAQETTRVGTVAVQTHMQSVRDQIRRGQTAPGAGAVPFAAETAQLADSRRAPWDALAYDAKSPMATKAPPPPRAPTTLVAAWAQGFADYERRTGTFTGVDIGRRTETLGGIAGIDATFAALGHSWTFGLFGGYTDAHVRNADGTSADVRAPSVGVYAIYMQGGWTFDSLAKIDFVDLDTTAVAFSNLGLTNTVVAGNASYRFDYSPWWFEPTTGITVTWLNWDSAAVALGFVDGHQVRLQAGLRTGNRFAWGTIRVEPVFALFVYGDVVVEGGTLSSAVSPLVPTDEGKAFGQFIAKLNFDYGRGLSSYLEGEVRGRHDVFGIAGRAGFRYTF